MNFENMKMTAHVLRERMGRIDYIKETIGFGETIRVTKTEGRPGIKCLTDTGVIIIRDEMDMRIVVTAYIATLSQARHMYPNGTLPHWLFEVVQNNVNEGHVQMSSLLTVDPYKANR